MATSKIMRELKSSIADLEWKPKDKTPKAAQLKTSEEQFKKATFDAFKLIAVTAQHQDPTAPMKPHEMAQPIFAVNQIQQQIQANKTLEAIMHNTNHNSQTMEFLQKDVTFKGNQVEVINNQADFMYNIDENVDEAKIVIYNSEGAKVVEAPLDKSHGLRNYQPAIKLPDGKYSFLVTGKTENKPDVNFGTYGNGRVTEVDLAQNTLAIGKYNIRVQDVKQVKMPLKNIQS